MKEDTLRRIGAKVRKSSPYESLPPRLSFAFFPCFFKHESTANQAIAFVSMCKQEKEKNEPKSAFASHVHAHVHVPDLWFILKDDTPDKNFLQKQKEAYFQEVDLECMCICGKCKGALEEEGEEIPEDDICGDEILDEDSSEVGVNSSEVGVSESDSDIDYKDSEEDE